MRHDEQSGSTSAQQDAQENQLAQARFAAGMQNLSNTLARSRCKYSNKRPSMPICKRHKTIINYNN
jgi:hypothetical protein